MQYPVYLRIIIESKERKTNAFLSPLEKNKTETPHQNQVSNLVLTDRFQAAMADKAVVHSLLSPLLR